MTPAERAVIDAARAWAADYSLSENVSRLLAAVRALPRPLSEQLAELRVGAVVEAGEKQWLVRANDPEVCELWLRAYGDAVETPYNWSAEYSEIEGIISNPDPSNG